MDDIQYSKESLRASGPVTDVLCPPYWHSHCFPLSPLARQRPEKINRALSLAQTLSSSLMKCNLPSANIIHHAPASVWCASVFASIHQASVRICVSALVFSFSVLQTAGTQIELEWLYQRRQNKWASLTHLFFGFCFAWHKTHTSNFLSIRWLSEILAISDFHVELHCAG